MCHLGKIGRPRTLAVGAVLPHDVDTHRPVRNIAANIHVALSGRKDVKIPGIRFPTPRDSFHEHGVRNIFDALHQPDQQLMLVVGLAWGKTDAAIAHDDRRHAVRR